MISAAKLGAEHGSHRSCLKTCSQRIFTVLSVLLTAVLISCSSESPDRPHGFDLEFLLGDLPLPGPASMAGFKIPDDARPPGAGFEGVLKLKPGSGLNSIDVLTDTFSIAGSPEWNITNLPPFDFEFVSDGAVVIPVMQTPQRSAHPYWEIILGPGRSWHEQGDGQWSRVSLPFALKEKNQNCTHNGVMTFAYKADGSISRVAWQVSSETCLYLKVDLWGVTAASYQPGPIAGAAGIVKAHQKNVLARMPVKSIEELTLDHPQVDLSAIEPPRAEDVSVYGFVANGTHYRSECRTRHGPYPFCEVLVLPSYSLAKSIFAGLYYLRLIMEWPEFGSMAVSKLVPECRLPDGRWDDVTMSNLINMTTGNYDFLEFGKDEEAAKMQDFFLAESHSEKIAFSCAAWPRQSEPGAEAVYHTTDDYILGAAMNAFLRSKAGPAVDVYRDFLYPRLLQPLNLSPLLRWTQRTYDEAAQPFTAYGLVVYPDDLVRIAASLTLSYSGHHLFDQAGFEQTLFRDLDGMKRWSGGRGNGYRNGFWGVEASDWLGCDKETWIPFMSGYGGIVVALMPNDTIYYYFSDGNIHHFMDAAVESNKIRNYCKE